MLHPISNPRVSSTLYKLADWLTSPGQHCGNPSSTTPKPMQATLRPLKKGKTLDGLGPPGARLISQQRPLRVLRVVDPGDSRNAIGRIVISGRMADVCAELDRLALRESAFA